MSEIHPIEGLMKTAMNSIQDMVDVNTIIGEPINVLSNTILIPVSKVSFGFAAGGSEFNNGIVNEHKKKDKEEETKYSLPFGGGSGAGVSISPVAFVVVSSEGVRIMPIEHFSSVDKLVDYIPDVLKQVNTFLGKTDKKQQQNQESKTKKTTDYVEDIEDL